LNSPTSGRDYYKVCEQCPSQVCGLAVTGDWVFMSHSTQTCRSHIQTLSSTF